MIVLRKDAELSLRIQLYRVVYVNLTSIEKQCDHDIRRKYGTRPSKMSIMTGCFGHPFLLNRVYFSSFHDQRFLFPSTRLFVPSFLVIFRDYATTQFFIDARFWSRFSLHVFSVLGQENTNAPDIDSRKQPSLRFVLRSFVFFLSFLFLTFFFLSAFGTKTTPG